MKWYISFQLHAKISDTNISERKCMGKQNKPLLGIKKKEIGWSWFQLSTKVLSCSNEKCFLNFRWKATGKILWKPYPGSALLYLQTNSFNSSVHNEWALYDLSPQMHFAWTQLNWPWPQSFWHYQPDRETKKSYKNASRQTGMSNKFSHWYDTSSIRYYTIHPTLSHIFY